MEEKYSLIRKHSELWRTLKDEDFEEEEIWDVVKEREDYNTCEVDHHKSKNKELSSLPIPIGSRMIQIPRTSSESSSANSSHEAKGFQQSAPVNIPDWSKIYGNDKVNKSVKSVSRYGNEYGYYDDDEGGDDDDEGLNHGGGSDDEEDDDGDDDDEYGTRVPPHEIIARRLARSQISSFSVFEGVGRTLKGRDLSKVRNSVLIKTGFLESL